MSTDGGSCVSELRRVVRAAGAGHGGVTEVVAALSVVAEQLDPAGAGKHRCVAGLARRGAECGGC